MHWNSCQWQPQLTAKESHNERTQRQQRWRESRKRAGEQRALLLICCIRYGAHLLHRCVCMLSTVCVCVCVCAATAYVTSAWQVQLELWTLTCRLPPVLPPVLPSPVFPAALGLRVNYA